MSMTTSTAPLMAPELTITMLRAHIEEFIALELTQKIDTQLAGLVHSSVPDLDNWDGANLILPRTVTTALLETVAERAIWHSYRRCYQRDINRLKPSL
ncbi:hypothetical protein [Aeromonas caviae]|uniref:hypothetical protein n=2 Tax=Aeromonadaceae TaxID=84642 RepID=UPI0029D51E4E|nr:hypothetical protein [Aeromonas caviae]MDX7704906.1 hypothetical protein [Aeromonas caviae]MDX7796848.1 hypothetical protein [Aeromonas caviae]